MTQLNLGQRIKSIRKSKGITATFIASKLNISTSTFWKMEHDLVRVRAEQLKSISEILGVEMDYFFELKVEKNAI